MQNWGWTTIFQQRDSEAKKANLQRKGDIIEPRREEENTFTSQRSLSMSGPTSRPGCPAALVPKDTPVSFQYASPPCA